LPSKQLQDDNSLVANLIQVAAVIGITALLQRAPTSSLTVSGRVVADDGKPIEGVQVWTKTFLYLGGNGDTQTNSDGRFSME
jgi:hypothetical protein